MRPLPVADLARAYEAVRAQAIGQPTEAGPRGLVLILDKGVAAWIAAWSSVVRPDVATAAPAPATSAFDPRSADLARMLTEMALASCRRCPA